MKRILLGGILFVTGFFGALLLLVLSVDNSVFHNGIGGFHGFLLGTDITFLFVISCILYIAGLIICSVEIYLKNKIIDPTL